MNQPYKYKAFISYSHQDKSFAKYLQGSIENYKIPKSLRKKYPHLPQDLKRTVFRDEDELSSASVLSNVLKKALDESESLIVVCSPAAAASTWVEEEIVYFKEREDEKIFAIVKSAELEDAVPLALRKGAAPLAVDARRQPKVAFLKIIAAILGVDFADLWEREKREKRKRFLFKSIAVLFFVAMAIYVYTLSGAISSNAELIQIESEIAKVTLAQKNKNLSDKEAYVLSFKLKSLQENKRAKEETLKWFGLLKTSISKEAQEVYNIKGVDEALAVLESSKSEAEDESYAKKNMLRAKLYVEKNDFENAGKSYKKAIVVDPSYINMYDYALFLMKENYLEEAQEIFGRLSGYDLHPAEKSNVLNRLGILYRKSKQISRAKEAYSEALALRESLANEKPLVYTNDLAWTYNNMGVLYKENFEPQASEESHKKALALRSSLMEQNPKKYSFYVSCSLHNMGELYACTQREGKAEALFLRSIEIRKKLIKENPKRFTPALASTYHELGLLYFDTKREVRAEKFYLKALELRRTLAKTNPHAYQQGLIDTLVALVKLYKDSSALKSKENFEEELTNLKGEGN
ncbi:MAG: tetratricopeptide repeat protein [Sulfurovum sp.]|nr:tetratricopeptide repeat protein [Sulfurovum sp.]